jgi:hypothetical protein
MAFSHLDWDSAIQNPDFNKRSDGEESILFLLN